MLFDFKLTAWQCSSASGIPCSMSGHRPLLANALRSLRQLEHQTRYQHAGYRTPFSEVDVLLRVRTWVSRTHSTGCKLQGWTFPSSKRCGYAGKRQAVLDWLFQKRKSNSSNMGTLAHKIQPHGQNFSVQLQLPVPYPQIRLLLCYCYNLCTG